MRQGIGCGTPPGMVSDHHHGLKGFIQLLHHKQRMTTPAPHQFDLLGQFGGDDIPPCIMGILDPDLPSAGIQGPLTCGSDLGGHLLPEFTVIGFLLNRLVRMGNTCNSLNVGTYVNLQFSPHCL